MSSEAASKRAQGRPPVFSEKALRHAAGFSYARQVETRRGAQDLVYRMFAVAAIEHFCESYPESAAELGWLLAPKRRHVLLSELGRIGQPTSDEHGVLHWNDEDVLRLIRAALEICALKPTTKAGVALIRDLRRRYRARAA